MQHLACAFVRVVRVAPKPGGHTEGEGRVRVGVGREREVMGDVRTILRALGAGVQRQSKLAASERVLREIEPMPKSFSVRTSGTEECSLRDSCPEYENELHIQYTSAS